MATMINDTLKFTRSLEAAGMPAAQAEALAEAINEHGAETVTTTHLDTTANTLRGELKNSELRIKLWLVGSQVISTSVVLGVVAKAHGWL